MQGRVSGGGVEAVRFGAGGQQTAADVHETASRGRLQRRHPPQALVDVVVEPTGTGSGRGQLADERDVIARDGVVQLTNGTSLMLSLIYGAARLC